MLGLIHLIKMVFFTNMLNAQIVVFAIVILEIVNASLDMKARHVHAQLAPMIAQVMDNAKK